MSVDGRDRKQGVFTRLGANTMLSSACVLDIIGLSNQALSFSAMSPLLAVFEARPISIFGFEELRVRVRVKVRGKCGLCIS